jgi:hypothetical protein
MKALIEAELFRQMEHQRRQEALKRMRRRGDEPVVIREASRDDHRRLSRLAALDGGPLPQGPTLVAECGGALVAALPRDGGRAIADPFEPTQGLVSLLELRRSQLRAA